MAKHKNKDFVQKNLSLHGPTLREFEAFCATRQANEGGWASFALYNLMRLSADDRDKLAMEFHRWAEKEAVPEAATPKRPVVLTTGTKKLHQSRDTAETGGKR